MNTNNNLIKNSQSVDNMYKELNRISDRMSQIIESNNSLKMNSYDDIKAKFNGIDGFKRWKDNNYIEY